MTGEPTVPAEQPLTGGPAPTGAPAPAPTSAPSIPVGTPVRDTTRDRVGVVTDNEVRYLRLRPLDGGREWDVAPERVEPVGPREVLHARVAEANHRSSRGSPA